MTASAKQGPPFEITETRPTSIVGDFDRFLEAVEGPRAYLTPREVLDRRTLHEMDGRMATFRTETHPRTDQRHYLLLNLFQCICMAGRLQRPGKDRGKVRMQPTERLSAFRALPPGGRYLALLEGLWVDCDWDDLLPWRDLGGGGGPGSWAAETVGLLAGARPGRPMVPGEGRGADLPWFFGEMAVFVVTLGFFGFVRYLLRQPEEPDEARKGEPLLAGLAVTPMGSRFLKVLKTQRPWRLWNLPLWGHTAPRFPGESIEPGDAGVSEATPFAEAFVPLVAGERQDLVLERPAPQRQKGTYVFRVKLGQETCMIAASDSHTLEDLHRAIQREFGLGGDHLYGFFMDGRRFSRHGYYDPRCTEPPYASGACLGDLDLYAGKRFLYLFDFGVGLELEITVREGSEKPHRGKPKVVSR